MCFSHKNFNRREEDTLMYYSLAMDSGLTSCKIMRQVPETNLCYVDQLLYYLYQVFFVISSVLDLLCRRSILVK